MTRLILWAYSLLAWVFWLGTDSIDIVALATNMIAIFDGFRGSPALSMKRACIPISRMKAMFPLSETCFHYQKKFSANQAVRLRCPENFWRGMVVSLRRIGLTSCLMRQACSPKIH